MHVAEMLPAALTDCVYLEQWLRGTRLDLIIRVGDGGRDLLVDHRLEQSALGHALRASAAWRRVSAAAHRWHTDDGAWRSVSALWLEFDLDAAPRDGTVPEPRVFIDFTADAAARPSAAERHQLAIDVLKPFVGETGVTDRAARALRRLIAALPSAARLWSLGVAHDARTIRVCIAGLAHGRLTEYLRAVRWPGNLDDLDAHVLGPFDDGPPIALVNLDVAGALLPRIGVEYLFDRRSQRGGVLREDAFLERLVERGLCDRTHTGSLRAWPRQSSALLPHAIWYSRLVRRVNHVKVVYGGGEAIAAKAYLCCFHTLMSGVPVAKE
jgi:hypothetical protein